MMNNLDVHEITVTDETIDEIVKDCSDTITVAMLNNTESNQYVADVIMSKNKNTIIIKGGICQMTTVEIENIVLDFDSKFREYYKNNFNEAYDHLCNYLDCIDNDDGMFKRDILDEEMRTVIDCTLKYSDDRYARFARKVTDRDILLIDELSDRANIEKVCKIITDTYAPKVLQF